MKLGDIVGIVLRVPKMEDHNFRIVENFYPGVDHVKCVDCNREYARHKEKSNLEFFIWNKKVAKEYHEIYKVKALNW